jgi:Golgi to ER traffic protein 4
MDVCLTRFADMMYDWSLKGYPSETDLYLTRGVLLYVFRLRSPPHGRKSLNLFPRLLARGSLKDANQFRDRFVSHITTLSPTPLMNFVRFLLLTLEASPTMVSFPFLSAGGRVVG